MSERSTTSVDEQALIVDIDLSPAAIAVLELTSVIGVQGGTRERALADVERCLCMGWTGSSDSRN